MCGIFGAINISGKELPFSESKVLTALQAIRHRGPDDEGVWYNEEKSVVLAQTRLSIIDLSAAGHQPMSNNDGSLRITFNGEIYNFQEIKTELEAKGYRFKSKTDTEVILLGYQEFGEGIVNKLRGMFAFAIYDSKAKKIFIARDRLGVKPFYYTMVAGLFVFCSEIKPIFETEILQKNIDENSLSQYLTFGKVYSPNTIFQKIKKLPAACKATIYEGSEEIKFEEYWSAYMNKIEMPSSNDESYFIDKTRELLTESVRLRMLSDVPVGVFLSGGVDSTANVALMSQMSSRVNTFTVGFKGQAEYDERKFAYKAAQIYKTNHHEYEIEQKDFINSLDEVMSFIDEPINDPTVLPIYFISKLARQNNAIVILNGDGSDEIFCGYNKWQKYLKLHKYFKTVKVLPRFAGNFLADIFSKNEVASDMLRRAMLGVEMYVGTTGALKGTKELTELEKNYNVYEPIKQAQEKFAKEKLTDNYAEWLMYWGLKSEVEHIFLYRADRMGMAHSIEIRVPFLDHKLVEFAAQMPQELKYKNGEKKYILKKALQGIVPDEFLYRKKQGFNVPIQNWAKQEMTEVVTSVLPKIFAQVNLLNSNSVQMLIKALQNDNPDLVWHLYALCVWYKNWFM